MNLDINLEQVGILLQMMAGIILGLKYIVRDRWLHAANRFLISILTSPSRSPERPVSIAIGSLVVIYMVFLITLIATDILELNNPLLAILIGGYSAYGTFLIIVREIIEPDKLLSFTMLTTVLFFFAISLLSSLSAPPTFLIQMLYGALLASILVPLTTVLAYLLGLFALLPRDLLGVIGLLLFLIGIGITIL